MHTVLLHQLDNFLPSLLQTSLDKGLEVTVS